MNLRSKPVHLPGMTTLHRSAALTTTELIVTMAIFCIVMMGAIQLHVFGLRQNSLVESKLGASDQARTTFAELLKDIREATMWQIGEGSETGFTPATNGTAQKGLALQLYPKANTNDYVRYFFDMEDMELRRWVSWLPDASSRLIARHLTNIVPFKAENHDGVLKTNLSYKSVIHITLEFSQFEFPITRVGEGYLYDSYKLHYKVTPCGTD